MSDLAEPGRGTNVTEPVAPEATHRRPGKAARFNVFLVSAAIIVLSLAGILADRQAPVGDQFAPRPSGITNWDWWRAPIETNAFSRQTGFRINANLSAGYFHADGQRAWVVGSDGAILFTPDGGKTWQPQASNTQTFLESIAFLADGQTGWVAGGNGVIMGTADGGKTWQPQASNTQAWLQSIVFLADGQRGWAVGGNGTILATTNGGKTWQAQASNTRKWLRSVTFLADGQRGWAVGGGGGILATTDGGKTWRPQAANKRASSDLAGQRKTSPLRQLLQEMNEWASLLSVAFLADGQRGWAAGRDGTILATTDGGENWQTQASNTPADLNAIAFLADGQRGWAAGGNGTILATKDGGKSWRAQESNTPASLSSVAFIESGQKGWAVGENGIVVVTADGGESWQTKASNVSGWLWSVVFLADGLRGWAVGAEGSVLETKDGGKTWHVTSPNAVARLWSIAFLAGGQRGWAAGEKGTLLATEDAGKTWQARASNTKADLFSVTFLRDGQRGWAAGVNGTLLSTTDGGKTWQSQASNTNAWLRSLVFLADGQRGWVVGWDGTILSTIDGGKTWQAQASNTKAALWSVAFLEDGQRGWVAGNDGALLATADGGKTWQGQTSHTKGNIYSIAFHADGQQGWAAGDDGIILDTANGGKDWRVFASNAKTGLTSIAFLANGQRGWAAGWQGAVLTTDDGGNTWTQQAHYRRLPAPWFWALLFAVSSATLGLGWWRARQSDVIDLQNRILTEAVEDGPVTDAARDRLGFGPIVAAMANFMRHESTRPPVTFAVTAPWGRGKSSLMRLLEQRLRTSGVGTVWFNAWHHQKEPVMLAALLEAITKQAIPFWLTPSGLMFRAGLLWKRFRRRPFLGLGPLLIGWLLILMVVSTASSLVQTLLGSHEPGYVDPLVAAWAQIFHALIQGALINEASDKLFAGDWAGFLKSSLGAEGSSPAALFVLVAWAYGAASLWLLVFHFLRPFPASPAALLASLGDKFNIRRAEEQTGFRQRFREHFAEVCVVLQPYTLTIFIDDLDRCDAAKAAEMLEAVNYLSDAGKCFLVLGMAKGIVEAQLGDAYKDIAERHAAFATLDRSAAEGNGEKARTEADRRDYARNYLRKLIQIEVPVPKFSAAELNALLADEAEQDRQVRAWDARWSVWLEKGRRSGHVVGYGLALALLSLALHHGYRWSEQASAKATEQAKKEAEQRLLRVEERRRVVLQAGAYRSWLKESQSAPGKLAKTADVAATARRLSHLEDVDRRWKRLDADLADLDRHARAHAEKEFKLADEDVARGLAAFDQLAAADRWQQATEPKPKPVVAASSTPEFDPLRREARGSGPLVVPPDPDVAPGWPYMLVWLTILLPGVWLIHRARDRYRIKESDDYKLALAAWQPVLLVQEHMRAPREAKRFLNLSRYLTLRINAAEYAKRSGIKDWLGKKLFRVARAEAGKVLDEATIVGMTALHLAQRHSFHTDPDFKACLVAPEKTLAEWAEEDTVVMNAVIEARSRLAGKWNPTEADIAIFLRVVGEMGS